MTLAFCALCAWSSFVAWRYVHALRRCDRLDAQLNDPSELRRRLGEYNARVDEWLRGVQRHREQQRRDPW